MELQPGANAALGAGKIRLDVAWQAASGSAVDVDVSAFLLRENGKVGGDQDMVFFNQKSVANGAVLMETSGSGKVSFTVEAAALPAHTDRVAFAVTLDGGKTLAHLAALSVSTSGAAEIIMPVTISGRREAALILAEIYRRNGFWKIRAVMQGFNGGLDPLARHYGVDVAEPAATPAVPPPFVPPAPAAAPPPAPVKLSKISLAKSGQSVSLRKDANAVGDILVNLNWTQQSPRPAGGIRGLLGGAPKGVDLDIGCLFEMQDGLKGAVQALGNSFGSLHNEPFIALSGDDRTGAVAAGETLTISAAKWSQIKRVALYAFIYEGVPNWAAADAAVTVRIPGQPPIEVRLDEHGNFGFCGIALLENDGGAIKVTRLVEYFKGHLEFDRRLPRGTGDTGCRSGLPQPDRLLSGPSGRTAALCCQRPDGSG